MAKQNKRIQWQGRNVLHEDHFHELERESALNEFGHKMPRHQAEEKAYQDYKRQHHLKAAAHHIRAMKLCQGLGESDEAKKHWNMYQSHAKEIGFSPFGPVPPEVQNHVDNVGKGSKNYKFIGHDADSFVLDKMELTGGLSEGKAPGDFDKLSLEQGTRVELEHTKDKDIAQRIAMDHLTEDPKYYEKLKTVEKKSELSNLEELAHSELSKTLKAVIKRFKK